MMAIMDISHLRQRRVTTLNRSNHTANHLHLLITHIHRHQHQHQRHGHGHETRAWTRTRSSALSKCVRAFFHIYTLNCREIRPGMVSENVLKKQLSR